MSKNNFYVARVVVPRQLPEGQVSDTIALVIDNLGQFIQAAVIAIFCLGLLFELPF